MSRQEMIQAVKTALWQGAELAGNVSDPSYEDLVAAKATLDTLIERIEARIKRYDEIIYASRAATPDKRALLEQIDLAKYGLKERYPEDYVDYLAYSEVLSHDILWYGYKWAREEREKDGLS